MALDTVTLRVTCWLRFCGRTEFPPGSVTSGYHSMMGGAPYCLHGLNAVYSQAHGWYRLDACRNKPGISAMFSPPHEALAFRVREREERDLPEVWSEPHPVVISAMETFPDFAQLAQNLPDVQLLC